MYVHTRQDPAAIRNAVRDMQARARAMYRSRYPRRSKAGDRSTELEEAFASQALLHQALLRLCLLKGVFTRKAYATFFAGADLIDGEADGSLVRPGIPEEPESDRRFLEEGKKKDKRRRRKTR
ncbi:MAG: hypothetical protein ACYTFG_20665 [Planctomycetota bacterium]|jgi:hypothetical protein